MKNGVLADNSFMSVQKPLKILIIDDDPAVCGLFEQALSREGYGVSSVTDGHDSFFFVRSQFFNVVILDIYLGKEIDGLSLLKKIKEYSPDTEVVMMTGASEIESALSAFKSGAYDYLKKPIDIGHLLQVVHKAAEKQSLEFERRRLITEVKFQALLLERKNELLEKKLLEDDARIFRLVKRGTFIQKLFEQMTETLPLGIMVADKEGKVLMCNKAHETFWGVSKDCPVGKNLFQDPLRDDLHVWRRMGKEFLSAGTHAIEIVDERPAKQRILSVTLSTPVEEARTSWGFIFVTADITKEKRMEEQSAQTEKMTAIGQLVASLAHQIRNPLAIILSAIQHCLETGDEGSKKYYEIVYRSVQNANKIISDLLDFAKPKPLEMKKHDINRLLEDICRLIRVDFSKGRIRILKRFDRGIPKVLCDRESLRQVFFNLLMNSKQAMPGGGCVSLTTLHNTDDQTVHIVVHDTGNGIPREHLPRIFDPYFTTKEKGTGLGLSIVHRIISDHGGEILPESKEGEGTKMNIILPTNLGRLPRKGHVLKKSQEMNLVDKALDLISLTPVESSRHPIPS